MTNFSTNFLTMTTSQATTTKSLTPEQRDSLAEFIALRYLDSMDGRDLERFFIDIQMEYLRDYTDQELIGEIEDLTDTEEFNAMMEVEL